VRGAGRVQPRNLEQLWNAVSAPKFFDRFLSDIQSIFDLLQLQNAELIMSHSCESHILGEPGRKGSTALS
jgi:hypothetical protein